MSTLQAPTVFNYLSVFAFLQDYYQYRKDNERKFSYASWSKQLSMKNRSFLRLSITGKKKLSPNLIERLSETIFIESDEKEYFLYLARYSQKSTSSEREFYGKKLIELVRNRTQPTVIEDVQTFVSTPLLPQILSLFGYTDFEVTLANLERLFNVPSERLLAALETLETMKLVERKMGAAEAEWTSQVQTFKVPYSHGDFDLMKFHRMSLQNALEAIVKPHDLTKFKSLLLPMNSEELELFNQMLEEFVNGQINRLNTKSCSGKRLFQANFNIYPVTEIV